MKTRFWFTPAAESLHAKRVRLGKQLQALEAARLGQDDLRVLERCRELLQEVDALDARRWGHHPHLAWRLMHQVDEELLLVQPLEEVIARSDELLATFDMNVTEKKMRQSFLGEGVGQKGSLRQAIEHLRSPEKEREARYVLREALGVANALMDRGFWELSMNTLTSVVSGVALGAAMLLWWMAGYTECLSTLGAGCLDGGAFARLALLGLMGGYLSNVLTQERFLYLRGGPFWRYALLHLVSRPILSAFGAVAVAVIAKSELVFKIAGAGEKSTGLLTLQVPGDAGYAYATLAVVSGFAADKVLRDMIGRVLKRLEQKAEKTKETRPEK